MSSRTRGPVTSASDRVLPGWLVPTTLVLNLVGLGTSAYLTYEHFTGSTTLACPENDVVSCARVTESSWSSLLGVPVARVTMSIYIAIGVLAMFALCLPSVLRRSSALLDRVRLALSGVGLVLALYLVWAELFQIHAICLWCTVVHVVAFLLFAVLLFGQILIEPADLRSRR